MVPHQKFEGSYIIEKHYNACVPPFTELIDIVENTII